MMKPTILAAATLTSSLIGLPLTAQASNGILSYGNGLIAHGVGGAGVANASEAMSALDNPALVARVGASWGVQMTGFNLIRSANMGRGNVESDKEWFPVPGGAWFTQINENTVAGVTVAAMGGINVDYPAQLLGAPVYVNLTGTTVTPTIATNLTDSVSLGAGLVYGYQTMETNGPGQGGLPRNDDDSASGWGVEVGIAIDLGDRTTLGLDYQSKIDFDIMQKHAAYLFAHASDPQITFPPITTLGMSHQINDQWKVMADISDLKWSDVAVLKEVFGWEDQTVYKIGAEMQVNERLAVRFGYNYGKSQIPDANVSNNILAPAITEKHYTVGFTKKLNQGSVTGYAAVVPEKEQQQAGGPGGFPSIKSNQNAFGLAYHVEFK